MWAFMRKFGAHYYPLSLPGSETIKVIDFYENGRVESNQGDLA